tara:strand:+ start:7183 stop:7527 length:345 start_codon:yes stop_codon:yes gene_type:complete
LQFKFNTILIALRGLKFYFALCFVKTELVNPLGQFPVFIEQRLDVDMGRLSLDPVFKVVVWLGHDHASFTKNQIGCSQYRHEFVFILVHDVFYDESCYPNWSLHPRHMFYNVSK